MNKFDVMRRGAAVAAVVGAAWLAGGCASTSPDRPPPPYLPELGGQRVLQGRGDVDPVTGVAYWDGDHVAGSPLIEVDLRKQQARFYKGSTLVGVTPISSGTEGRNTPAGNYKILEKDIDHVSSSYGTVKSRGTGAIVNDDATPRSPVPPGCFYEPAPMPYFMRLTWDGVGMHEGYLPGYPASHGCIRMNAEIVRKFYQHASLGTPVRVIR